MRFLIRLLFGFVSFSLTALPQPLAAQWEIVGGPGGCEIDDLIVVRNTILASTDFGIYRSTDEGARWKEAVPSLREGRLGWTGRLYACGEMLVRIEDEMLFVSSDLGASWKSIYARGLPSGLRATAFLEKDGIWYLGSGEGNVYLSKDRGESWERCVAGLPDNISEFAATEDGLFARVFLDGLYRSKDNGATWTKAEMGLPRYFSWDSLAVSDGRLLACDADDGIFIFQGKEESWRKLDLGYGGDAPISCMDASGPFVIAAREDGATLLSSDGGLTWTSITPALPEFAEARCIAVKGPLLFVGTAQGVIRSDDRGATWRPVNAGLPSQTRVWDFGWAGKDFFAALSDWGPEEWGALNSHYSKHSATGAVFKTTEGEANWQPTGLRLPKASSLECFDVIGSRLLAGSETGIYVSDDAGRNWRRTWPEERAAPSVYGFAVTGDRIFAGTGEGLYRSSDRGSSWTRVSANGFDEARILCLLETGPALFAGGSMGLYVSRDRGETWGEVGSGFPKGATCVSLASAGKNVIAGIYPRTPSPFRPSDAGVTEIVLDSYPKYAILASKDGGRTWSPAGIGLPKDFRICRLAAFGSAFVAALEDHYLKLGPRSLGLFLSTDERSELDRRMAGAVAGDANHSPSGKERLSLCGYGWRRHLAPAPLGAEKVMIAASTGFFRRVLAGVFCLVASFGCRGIVRPVKPSKPNIILYVIDGAAAELMSVYGHSRRTTPYLERLAAEGALFENAYSNSSLTKVSVPALMTSLHGSVLGGHRGPGGLLPARAVTMAERLHRAGYLTEVLTSNPYCGRMSGLDRGVDILREAWRRNKCLSSADLHREFWRLREANSSEPHWAHFQTTDVHRPWSAAVSCEGRAASVNLIRALEDAPGGQP
ncbi:MAG: sulfatase-like hydrolase/transferase, partial [Candidatus Aminicenantales bacterium]